MHRYREKLEERLKKWAVPEYMYKPSTFPVFLSGSGYVMTRKEKASMSVILTLV